MNATLIVGLGNPGREYERTRHDLGWRVLDELVKSVGVAPHQVGWRSQIRLRRKGAGQARSDRLAKPVVAGQDAGAWSAWKREGDALIANLNTKDAKHFALKPQTFMNDSGIPVARFVKFYQIPLEKVWIVHDDVDLPFGKLREAFDRGSAGHKGVESIIEHLGSPAFNRLRIGVGSNRERGLSAEDYVLQRFTETEERALTDTILPEAVNQLRRVLERLSKKEEGRSGHAT